MKMTEKEFKNLVLPCKDKLFRLAFSLLGNRPAAEDAVQEVYLKLWCMSSDLPVYNSLEALAMRMMKNLCIDTLRSYHHRKKNDNGLDKVKMTASQVDPARSVELNETLAQVHAIIRALPEQQRLVLHLRDVEQYSYDEIEKMTEMSRNNIRVTLSRARKKVQKEYSNIQDDE